MTLNKLYRQAGQVDEQFWRDLRVGYDRIAESTAPLIEVMLKRAIEDISNDELVRIYGLFGMTFEERTEHLSGLVTTLKSENKLLLILLREFQNRRKRFVEGYYLAVDLTEKSFASSLGQLLQMFLDSPRHLIHIFTEHIWSAKATGLQLLLNKPMSYAKTLQAVTEKGFTESLVDELHKKSNNRHFYRFCSEFAVTEKRVLVLLYKQINDVSRPNFDQAKRDREVSEILFEFQVSTQIVEIKGATKSEAETFSAWAGKAFIGVFEEVQPEVFEDFKADDVKAKLRGEKEEAKVAKELVVEKVTVRGSLLKNSPELTFELPKLDVWPSVKDAHDKKCLSLESIKDIKRMTVRVNETSRMIRSNVLRNGNVIFTFDDGRMDESRRSEISRLFEQRFGIPLFKQISNVSFRDGYADKIDYAMGLARRDEYVPGDIYDELFENQYLSEREVSIYRCLDRDCEYFFPGEEGDVPDRCPECDSELRHERDLFVAVNMKEVTKRVRQTLGLLSGSCWTLENDTESTINGVKYRFLMLEHENATVLRVLILDKNLSTHVLKRFHRTMIPTLFVYVGTQQSGLDGFNDNCTAAISFGSILSMKDEALVTTYENIYEDLEQRTKHYTAEAAYEAQKTMQQALSGPKAMPESYADDFEDDVYAVIKDMIPNVCRWGKEAKGRAVPEGVFTLTSAMPGRQKRKLAFSFDCKFTRSDDGYDLNRGEQRKAAEYVRKLNDSEFVAHFSTSHELTGHVFISNRFKKSNFASMTSYFREHVQDDGVCQTEPIFLRLDDLIELHRMYRKYPESITRAPNVFYRQLAKALSGVDDKVVSREALEEAVVRALKPDLAEFDTLDMGELKSELDL